MNLSDHQERYLENVSVAFWNEKLIGDMLFPIVKVKKQSDKVAVFKKRSQVIYETKRGVDGKSNRVRWDYETASYVCENHALHDFVTDKRIRNADTPIEPLARTTENVTDAVLLAREARRAGVAFNTATYDAVHQIDLNAGDYTPWNEAGSDPYGNVLEGKEKCAIDPNTLVLGRRPWFYFRQNAAIKSLVSGGATTQYPAVIRETALNDLLELEYILIGKAYYDSTPKQSSGTRVNLWGDHALLAYVEPRMSLDMLSFAFTPMWTDNGGTDGYVLNTWNAPDVYGGATYIEVEEDVDEFVVCPTAACFLENAVVIS